MKEEDFQTMRTKSTLSRFNMCDKKSVGYTKGSEDRLNNFKKIGESMGREPEEVLAVYYGKHDLAFMHYKASGEEPSDGLESTIDDLQNYLDLARALYLERQDRIKALEKLMEDMNEEVEVPGGEECDGVCQVRPAEDTDPLGRGSDRDDGTDRGESEGGS